MKWFLSLINMIKEIFNVPVDSQKPKSWDEIITPVKKRRAPIERKPGKIRLQRPVPEKFKISSPFGYRTNPVKAFHNGIDFACPVSTEVFAMTDGHIFKIGWQNPNNEDEGLGLRVWQEFFYGDSTYYCWYGHLSAVLVDIGQPIRKGQVVGLSGNTGHSTGPHLHVQVREKDTGHYYDMEFYTSEVSYGNTR